MKRFLLVLICLILTSCSPSDKIPQQTQASEPSNQSDAAQSVDLLPSRIAFSSNRDGNVEVYVMDADGRNQTCLTNTPFFDGAPAWSGDGQKIAFITDRDGNAEIYVMEADGSNPVNLTNSPYDDSYPDWSPDMSRIVFESQRDGDLEIYVMDADGSNQTRLTNSPGEDYGAEWSPDGSQIAFTSLRDGNTDIYIMQSDGSSQTNLTNSPANEVLSSWPGDGSRMIFDSDFVGHYEIYAMNRDASNPVPLTNGTGNLGYADLSPDGLRILVARDNGSDWDILVMNADGTGLVDLVTGAASDYDAVWSPGFTLPGTSVQANEPVVLPSETPFAFPTRAPTSEAAPYATYSLLGWVEFAASGTVDLGQETPTMLDQIVIFHRSDALEPGVQCCYAIEPAIDVEVNIPNEDINGSDIIFRTGQDYEYSIVGYVTERTVSDFFLGTLPVFTVTVLTRVK